jgi:hypothetical protein
MTDRSTSREGRRRRTLVTKRITVPGNLRRCCDEFNGRQYFECHETLEELWQEEQGQVRDLYKGLIQIAAAFVHITRGNHTGARRLLATGAGYLEPYRERGAMGFHVDDIVRDARAALDTVNALGPGRVQEFDLSRAPVFSFDESVLADAARRWQAWGFDPSGAPVEMEITVVE